MHAGKLSVAIRDSAVFSRLDATSGVVLELDRKRYYMLNETGTALLELLPEGTPRPFEELLDTLAEEFEVDRKALAEDIAQYLLELEGWQVVTLQRAADPPNDAPPSSDRP